MVHVRWLRRLRLRKLQSDVSMNIYSHKIPSTVREAMSTFSGEECYLIRRRKKGLTGKGIQGNCHFNVQGWVDKIGGERLTGWLLYRNRSLINKGLWVWIFHSLWKTPEGQVVDVTQDSTYEGSDFTTVWLDKNRNIDIILLDLMMPDLDGIEFLEGLQAIGLEKNIPVILQTGSTNFEFVERALSRGAIGYISKPFIKEEAMDAINRVFNR